MKHTEGSWEVGDLVENDIEVRHAEILGDDGVKMIAKAYYGKTDEECAANANRIVDCVNSHDELLEACITALNIIEQCIDYENLPNSEAELLECKRIEISNAVRKAKEQ